MEPDEEIEADAPKYDHRKIWGAGYHAGLKAKGIESIGQDYMNNTVLAAKYRSLQAYEQKVLAVIPIEEHWTSAEICTEYTKIYGTMITKDKCERALNRLLDHSLVKESCSRYWRDALDCIFKEVAKPKLVESVKVDPVKVKPKEDVTLIAPDIIPENPFDAFFKHLDDVRALLSQLDADALALETHLSNRLAEYKKLDQLRDLLNSIK